MAVVLFIIVMTTLINNGNVQRSGTRLEKPEDTLAQDNKEIQVLCSKLFNANFLIAK